MFVHGLYTLEPIVESYLVYLRGKQAAADNAAYGEELAQANNLTAAWETLWKLRRRPLGQPTTFQYNVSAFPAVMARLIDAFEMTITANTRRDEAKAAYNKKLNLLDDEKTGAWLVLKAAFDGEKVGKR